LKVGATGFEPATT